MTEIKIKACFNGNVLIDHDGITVYDKEFAPATFNLIFKDGFYYITSGQGYHQYKWGYDFLLKELQVRGHGIFHVNMNYFNTLSLLQERAIVHLFGDIEKLIVYNYCGILSGTGVINQLKVRMIDGVMKNFTIKNIDMIVEKYKMMDIKSTNPILSKIIVDKTSEVIVNDVKIQHKIWPKY